MSQDLDSEHVTPKFQQGYDAVYPPDWAQTEAIDSRIDGSDAIFTLYLEISLKEDEMMIGAWNHDAKSIIIFSGLFSATVAAALGPSLPDQSSNTLIESTSYVEAIYFHLTANDTVLSLFPFFDLPNFQLVNSLWFFSLVISLTCALLAVSLQQWTHRYLVEVQRRGTPCSQARIREYLAEGIRESRCAVIVDVMRACHQVSFLLFSLGLCAYFLTTDYVTLAIVSSWFLVWSGLYIWMSITAIFRHNSPYRSPLSSILYHFAQLVRFTRSITPGTFTRGSTGFAASNSHRSFLRRLSQEGMREAMEESVRKYSEDLDSRILGWTFNSLTQDHEFERFFAGIPDFCDSKAVRDPKDLLLDLNNDQEKLSRMLFVWIYRSVTSHLISEPARQQRIKIFTKVIDAVPTIVSWTTLQRVFKTWDGLLGSVDFGSVILRTGGNSDDPCTSFCARCIVAIVIARRAQVYDGHCFNLATQFLTSDMEVWVRISPTLRGCLEHSHSAMLANLIFITRTILRFHSEHSRDKLFDVSSQTLSELSSNIDVRLASSEMQHEFCGFWNELVHEAQVQAQEQNRTGTYAPTITTDIFRHLRKIYIVLHESTDTSLLFTSDEGDALIPPPGSSYPLCNVQDHRHMSPQTSHLVPANLTNPPSTRSRVSAPLDSILPNSVAGATEDVKEAPNVASPGGVTLDHVEPPSSPTPSRPPLTSRPSVEIIPAVQESRDQSDRTFTEPESPSLAPDARQSLPLLHHEGGW